VNILEVNREKKTMLTVTESAKVQVLDYFKGGDIKPVRIFVNSGCGGQQLALAVDDQQPGDTVHSFGELTFLVEQKLMEKAHTIKIDFDMQGFSIDSKLELLQGGCSSCASGGSCGV
jgi:Fe-S cluster assembly iron-binding protein IscA